MIGRKQPKESTTVSIEYTIAYININGLTESECEKLTDWADNGPPLLDEIDTNNEENIKLICTPPTEWYPKQKMFIASDSRSLPFWRESELIEFYSSLKNQAICEASSEGITSKKLRDDFVRIGFVKCKYCIHNNIEYTSITMHSVPQYWNGDSDYFDEPFIFADCTKKPVAFKTITPEY